MTLYHSKTLLITCMKSYHVVSNSITIAVRRYVVSFISHCESFYGCELFLIHVVCHT